MKLLTRLVFVFFITTAAHAQFDERFYFPVKEWKSLDGVTHEEVTLPHDSVSLSAIFLKPAGKPKGTILFLHGAGGNVTSYCIYHEAAGGTWLPGIHDRFPRLW
ncbi:hypothetical protein KK062_14140 [Fulvivirgaceae bacterium PWU5]|uniref:Alpha/beta hydrolase n=1 Tax=Dawidia cretensis TaxID=2782350 RepID=A0AAP2GUD2_9BACT|nr:hypothetical protein [Dawidia cretensis]MBT1709378.1 hypothetical protein [Dawidia cretensis]